MLRSTLALAFAITLVACSGGSDVGSSENGAPNGSSGGGGGAGSGASEGSTTPLDTSSATSVSLALGYCGGAPGTCNGQHSFTITFATSELEKSTCVPGEVDPETNRKTTTTAKTTRVLTADEMRRVREALLGVKKTSAPFAMQWDGNMHVLTVTSPEGRKDYSPEASCNHQAFSKIVGFDEAWKLVESL